MHAIAQGKQIAQFFKLLQSPFREDRRKQSTFFCWKHAFYFYYRICILNINVALIASNIVLSIDCSLQLSQRISLSSGYWIPWMLRFSLSEGAVRIGLISFVRSSESLLRASCSSEITGDRLPSSCFASILLRGDGLFYIFNGCFHAFPASWISLRHRWPHSINYL